MTLEYYMMWVVNCGLLELASMGTYKVKIDLLDMIISSYKYENFEVFVFVNNKTILLTLKQKYVHRLKSISCKDGEAINCK